MRTGWGVTMLLLAGCGGTPTNDTTAADAAPSGTPVTAAPAPTPTATPVDASLPERPVAPDTAQAAADVVQRYHALIEAKRYGEAYRLWEPGAVGMTSAAFAAGFAKYAEYHGEIGAPGDVDAGAGQRYVTVPVRVYGRLAAGGGFALEGPFTLHRVADIDGSTAEQRRWRIRSSALEPRPAAAPDTSDAVTARYRCIDGSRLVAEFAADAVTLRRGGVRLGVLPQQRAASGIWYKRDGLDLRGKGDAATFSEPGKPPIACTAIR